MSQHQVPAGNGMQWISSAFEIVMKNPGVFIVMALIIAVLGAIPVINLAMVILGPALYGGLMYAAARHDRGETAEIGDVFAAFQQPGKIGPMILLCLPSIVALVVVVVLGFVLIGGAVLTMMGGHSGGLGAAAISGLLLFFPLALAVALFVGALLFFAIPRVMLDAVEPFAAFKESLSAVLANFGAVLLFALVLIVGFVVLGAVLIFVPILGPLALMLASTLIGPLGSYSAYREVFGVGSAVLSVPPSAPPPPPVVQ